jgi:hypothetical protein
MTIEEENKFMEESKKHFKEWHDMNYIPKADYENRLKADMVAMLTEISLEADELSPDYDNNTYSAGICDYDNLVQAKIKKLRGEEE